MLTLARDQFENGLQSLLPLDDFKGVDQARLVPNTQETHLKVSDDVEPNFCQEPKKAKRQLKRLLAAVASFIRPREAIINEARQQTDATFIAPEISQSSKDE